MAPADPVLDALERVIGELPGGGEPRSGQREMAEAVRLGIAERKHVAVQAGTGTGKTLAYLVPAILSGRTTVVATATKALQDQLAGKDLPFLQRHLRHRVRVGAAEGTVELPLHAAARRAAQPPARTRGSSPSTAWPSGRRPRSCCHLVDWAATTETGDRAELDVEPSERAWSALSVSAQECPGAARCPSGGGVLRRGGPPPRPRGRRGRREPPPLRPRPRHGRACCSPTTSWRSSTRPTSSRTSCRPPAASSVTGGRFFDLARRTRGVIADDRLPAGRRRRRTPAHRGPASASRRAAPRRPARRPGRRHHGRQGPGASRCWRPPATCPIDAPEDTRTQGRCGWCSPAARCSTTCPASSGSATTRSCGWRAPTPTRCSGSRRSTCRGCSRSGSGTSAPLCSPAPRSPPSCPLASACATAQITELDVGSPFDYEDHALLYCAAHLPDPRNPGYVEALTDELGDLIEAAGGRTLALFTSFRVLDEAAAALQLRFGEDLPILTQRDLPKAKLLEQFTADEATSLFATMGFWQGVDVPGPLAQPGRHRPHPVPAPRRAAPRGPPRARRLRRPSASSTSPAPPPSSPRAPAASSAPPPTAASSPSSTPASPRPATAGTSSTPSHRCAGPRTATKPSAPSSRSATSADQSSEPQSRVTDAMTRFVRLGVDLRPCPRLR